MHFFLDTANLEEIRQGVRWGVVSGVTTNPSLVAREGEVDFHQRVREIAEIVDGPVSAEVISTDAGGMIREARFLSSIHPNVVVKIPITPEGMAAVKVLSKEGIRTNVTLVFSPQQALLGAMAGAAYVSPFIGRLDDIGEDGIGLVRDIAALFRIQAIKTQIIAASMRHPRHVYESALAGASICTLPFKVLELLFRHPLTDIGLERFLADWEGYERRHERNKG